VKLGLHALGIGAGADRAVIAEVSAAAERCGFATLWSGEHVVMVDQSTSRYPYSADGQIAVPAQADWIDPMIGLAFAAAATSTIGIATGVLLLPEHNAVHLAKQAATLDTLSGGRFTLGIGIGWSREEFDALGVPFERRGARTAEYVAAMRTLWRDDVASFGGEFVSFDSVRVNPKPVRDRLIPIVLGGNSDAAGGTASTSTTCPPRPNESRRCRPCVGRPTAIPTNCVWRWPYVTRNGPTSPPWPNSEWTSWWSWPGRRTIPGRPASGWPALPSSGAHPQGRQTSCSTACDVTRPI
jgi:probable F420-dependent oxidoreductase